MDLEEYPIGSYVGVPLIDVPVAITIFIADISCSIQDGGVTVFWGLSDANVEQNVAFGDEDEGANQRWILIPV